MKEIKDNMSKDEIKALVKQTKDLIAYQNKQDTKKELATLPELKIKDINRGVNYLDSKKTKVKGMNGIYHEVETNGIAYASLHFALDKLSIEELAYVDILSDVLLEVNTKNYKVDELNTVIKTYLGSFSVEKTQVARNHNRFDCMPYLSVRTSALEENIEYIPQLINEVLFKSKFTQKEIKTILTQEVVNLKNGLTIFNLSSPPFKIRFTFFQECFNTISSI